jgi:hypothetical protein
MSWSIFVASVRRFRGQKMNVFMRINISLSFAMVAAAAVSVRPAAGQTYFVTNNADSGAGSLRQAITSMNAAHISPSSIDFSGMGANKTIMLLTPLPDITVSANVNSTNVSGIVLDGASATMADGLRF